MKDSSQKDSPRPDVAVRTDEIVESHSVNVCVVSVIWICSGNDRDALKDLKQYVDALAALSIHCELNIVVNGGSRTLRDLSQLLQDSSLYVRVVEIHRQSDESTAICAGLEASQGELVVLLPGYVQSDPAAIVDMIAAVKDGAHYVATWRTPRIDSGWGSFKSRLFNQATSYLTGVTLHDINSGLRLMTRDVADHLPIYGDLHRFSPILAALQGYRVVEVRVRHLKELRVEKGDNRFGVYLRRILDLLTLFFLFKFTKKPLRFFGLIGSASLALGVISIAWISVQRFLGTNLADRPALLLAIVFIVLGAQLFSVGLLGELIIFTHGRHLFHLHVEEVDIRNTGETT